MTYSRGVIIEGRAYVVTVVGSTNPRPAARAAIEEALDAAEKRLRMRVLGETEIGL